MANGSGNASGNGQNQNPPYAEIRNPLRNYQFRIGLLAPRMVTDLRSNSASAPLSNGASTGNGIRYVAGVKRVSGLNLSIGANEVWSGGNSLHRYANPNKVTWDPITLEQGLALSNELENWARDVLDFVCTGYSRGKAVKRNVYIDIWDPFTLMPDGRSISEGVCLRRYVVKNAWISRYQALPQLDAMSNEVALLSVELIHEGWRIAVAEDTIGGFTQL